MFQIHFWKGKNWRSSLRVSSLLLPLQTVKITSQQFLLQCPTCSNTVSLHSLSVRRFGFFSLFTFPTLCILMKEITSVFTSSTSLLPEYERRLYLLVFVFHKIKKWEKYLQSSLMLLRQFLPNESISTFSMLFFSIPLVKILLPQFTRSTAHWKHAWANAKTEFHTERGMGGSNQGSRLTYKAKSKIHYRIGKISIYKDPEKREIISLSGSWK